MLTRRHSIFFAVLALAGGLLLWSWDDILADLLQGRVALHAVLGSLEFILLGPGMAVMAYAVTENVRVSRASVAREREQARLQRLAALGRVAAGLAHEVRNPLHNIRLLLEESRQATDAAERDAMQARVDANLVRIDRAVELVYRLARPPATGADGRTCDLAAVAAEAVATERARGGVSAAIALSGVRVAMVAASADDASIALDNLLRNATAASGGRTVTVEVLRADACWQVRVRNPGRLPAAVLAVGHGDGFGSGKPGGLGLGLAISRQLAIDAGGGLDLGQDGEAVEARLTLPMAGDA